MLPASPLSAWLSWLETLSPREIDLGLERVHDVLRRLDIEYPDHVLIIAGTNGKGSSVAMAEALLSAAGWRVGAYTSPHIVDYNERIAVDGRPADDETIVAAFEAIESVRGDVPLTYFEYGTLAALVVFARAGLDVWLLEVGMGGRLDAVNAVEPTGVLITNVSLDHCDWLGEDVEAIAAEKAGVMRPDVPVVFGDAAVPGAVLRRARETGARLLLRERDFPVEGVPRPGLAGEFQVGNAAAVLALLDAAGLGAATEPGLVARVLPAVGLQGRGQRIERDGIEWLFDVAHNPAAAGMLAQTLAADAGNRRTIAIVAMLDDKDVDGFARSLDEHVDLWIATTASGARALPAGELARRIANVSGRPCLIAGSHEDAVQVASKEAARGDRIVVTGSFYLVGPVLQRLGLYSPRRP
ncbi:MAG: bifunctional folylpolyglutamate synthase/dihydrofolate synthase [Gammaproteobacteria bacterium]|nr:bifunctional folylpolyglutamate synthase/dihydrofolate synthase [Gammaproteobacteria bacterium]NNF50163.1 bifunctional folylpolyglutamate synthase/dihydrofolate synthase [Woeseiaceae bacterium]MBT8093936.1 bifunctional folylpolyglutamate synthase/dihydrofolate synthase [Gammaproteobacteria bacterium]MBT8106170.1 bifunctional folylpolyglutamate synthase/dihydrofolate synthase [Gammaproteobacteria bacterium]NNK26184.1 bifunctional folylpolyglutamate synthase/dihydrofolate synthase [Woeseiaceae